MGINQAQLQAIQHKDGPAMVLAGPGSGKTLVITQRTKNLIERYQIAPGEILVITFTKAAAIQMQERFERLMKKRLLVSFGTFHSVFFKILKYAYGLNASNIVREEQRQVWFKEMQRKISIEVSEEGEFIANVLGEISLVKGELLDPKEYQPKNCSPQVFFYFYQGYERKLQENRLIDFDDMLKMTYELLTARKDILKGWQKKYKYILIDEFQDICRVQYEIIRLLALPENNLFIVGDDDQAIYQFRGAKPEIMLNFPKDYPDTAQIILDQDYRSTKSILSISRKVIEHNTKRFKKDIKTQKEEGYPVSFFGFPSAIEESLEIIKQVEQYKQMGYSYSDMAVLYRTNSDPRLLAERFIEFNIPFRMKDALPDLYEHWIAKNIFSYIKIAMGSRERNEFLQIINRPKRYISRECFDTSMVSFDRLETFYEDKKWMLERIDKLKEDISYLQDLSPYAAISYIRKGIGYEDYLREYAKEKHIEEKDLFFILDEIQESAEGYDMYEEWFDHIKEYKEELKRQQKLKKQDGNQVEFSTLHSSKGLEYPIVFIIDINEGIIPYHKAELLEEIEEERRMFYVGMTRAKERLHLYWVKERYNKTLQISRFLQEIQEEKKDR